MQVHVDDGLMEFPSIGKEDTDGYMSDGSDVTKMSMFVDHRLDIRSSNISR